MKFKEFKENIEQVYKSKFPNSLCNVSIYKGFNNSIYIKCYLAHDSKECASGYLDNDMFNIAFDLELPKGFDSEMSELPEDLTMEKCSFSYNIKTENSIMYYGSRRIPYRKVSGNCKKIIKSFEKCMDKLHMQLIQDINEGQIHNNFVVIIKEKVI